MPGAFAPSFCDQEHYNRSNLDLASCEKLTAFVRLELATKIIFGYAGAQKEVRMLSKLKQFLRYLQNEKGYSQGTIEVYKLDIERGLLPFLQLRGKSEVEEVTKADIRDYLDYLANGRSNSNATRARKLAAIKSFFNYLVENEGLEVNPAASVRSPRIPEKEPVYLTDEESIRLLTTIAREARAQVRDRDLAMVILFLHTGLRVSELTKLELTNVDLDWGQIKITRKGNKEQYLHLTRVSSLPPVRAIALSLGQLSL